MENPQIKITQISATQGADGVPVVYALFTDGSLRWHTSEYGWNNVEYLGDEQESWEPIF